MKLNQKFLRYFLVTFYVCLITAEPPKKPQVTQLLQVKLYCTGKPFKPSEVELPTNFKPYGEKSKYSFFYKPTVAGFNKDVCYILLGYTDKTEATQAGHKFLTAPLTVAAPELQESPKKTMHVMRSADCLNLAVDAVDAPKPVMPFLPAQQPKTATPAPSNAATFMPEKDNLLLEIVVLCTNNPKINVTDEQVQNALPSGATIGDYFDLANNKHCIFVVKNGSKLKQELADEAKKKIVAALKWPEIF